MNRFLVLLNLGPMGNGVGRHLSGIGSLEPKKIALHWKERSLYSSIGMEKARFENKKPGLLSGFYSDRVV